MKIKILIIEDNNDIRESTAEILELAGYEVKEANNGKAGIELVHQFKPDLILCDIMMPELDGYGVLYMLNKNPETAATPFIFLTAKAERIDLRKGMEMGADDYLTKPFDDIELLNAIESRLSKKEKQLTFYNPSWQRIENLANGANSGIAELQQLISSRKVRQIKKKQVLFYEGDSCTGIYLVLDGSIKTTKMAHDGRELMTGFYHTNDYIGVTALLSDETFNETAQATEDSSVCLLPKERVLNLINHYPEIGGQFIKLLANNVRAKEEQLMELAYHSVRKRLAQTLVRLSRQSAEPAVFKVSREDLAAMAGIATETVSRTLSDFKDEGLIEKRGSQINLLNVDRLTKMKN
jgi:CRP-like cAMP-binding protein